MFGLKVKSYIALFFLAGFLLFRVGNLHVATHAFSENDKSSCELCDLIAHTNKSFAFDLGPAPVEVPLHNLFELRQNKVVQEYNVTRVTIQYFTKNFNRPPPCSSLG